LAESVTGGSSSPPGPVQRGGAILSHGALFSAFLKIGMLGFGGVTGWVRQVLVEERGYLDDHEFAGLLGVASVLPGANTVNMAVMLGDRHQGLSGALCALAGLLLAPLLCLVAIATLYDRVSAVAGVRDALAGAAAATAGLVLANAIKMGRGLGTGSRAILVAGTTFAVIGIFHFPLAISLLAIAPASLIACVIFEP
jgi:chromate transporter